MNWKKLLITFIVVYIVFLVLDSIIHGILLAPAYERLQNVWRPDMMDLMWVIYVTNLIMSFFFVYIFVRGYENKGAIEGVRFGLVAGCFVIIPGSYALYAMYNLPYSLILQWVLYGMVQFVIIGIVAAIIYKPLEQPATKTA